MKYILPLSRHAILLAIIISSTAAFASPWTAPADEFVLTLDQDFQFASREFLPSGKLQLFSLNATYQSQTTRIGMRYGFTERFEGAIDLTFSHVTFKADPFVFANFEDGATARDATNAIINFNTSEFGTGDFFFHTRYNFIKRQVLLTTETTVKLPTDYTRPTGTFISSVEEAVGGSDKTILTGGQATLGDGQSDLTQSLLLGTYIPQTRTFIRLDTGLRYRFGTPGHQALANFRAGQFIGNRLVIAAGIGYLKTITEGQPIGDTFIAKDPRQAAAEFSLDNLEIIPIALDRDALNVDGTLIFSVGDFELLANYAQTVLGKNTAAIHSFTVGAIFVFPEVTGH